MKILHVNVLYPPHKVGGAERSVALLAESLVSAGEQVTVVTLDQIKEQRIESAGGVKIYRLPMDNIYWPYDVKAAGQSKIRRLIWHIRNSWNKTAAARFGAVLDIEKPDVVHCHVITGFSPSIWKEVKKRKIPLVQTLRDYGLICTRSSLFKGGEVCGKRCVECRALTYPAKRASHLVDQVVSISDYVLDVHHREGYFPGVLARRTFNIVNLRDRDRLQQADDAPLAFGFIGRVEAEKGIEVLLEAVSRLDRDDWTLRVAGVGVPAYQDALVARYPDPRIIWLGFAESDRFYEAIDTLIVPSIWAEPLGRTVIEGLSFGLSLICAEAGGIPETASLARKVITYEPNDADALARAMRVAIDAKIDWRRGGLRDARSLELFSADRIVSETRSAYRDAEAKSDERDGAR